MNIQQTTKKHNSWKANDAGRIRFLHDSSELFSVSEHAISKSCPICTLGSPTSHLPQRVTYTQVLTPKEPAEYYSIQVPRKARSKRLSKKLTQLHGPRTVLRRVHEVRTLRISSSLAEKLNALARDS